MSKTPHIMVGGIPRPMTKEELAKRAEAKKRPRTPREHPRDRLARMQADNAPVTRAEFEDLKAEVAKLKRR
jgi:hypothetical protein